MNAVTSIQVQSGVINHTSGAGAGFKTPDGGGAGAGFKTPDGGVPAADIANFESALQRQMQSRSTTPAADSSKVSLGDKLMERTTNLAGSIQKDQQYVSKLLEQATRTGDSMQLMKAMMALGDYQMRVQTISKTVSKATSGIEQLTKLQ